ncbi:MAG: UDP-glucose 4-epimerase, partial [Actinomycetota bacterium]
MPRKPTIVAPTSAVVIGGAGFIGSHLVDRLLDHDVTVDVVDDFTTGSLANLAEARARGARLSIQQLDAAAPELSTLLERRTPEVLYLVRGLGSDARHPLLAVEALAVLVACLEAIRTVSPKSKVVAVLPASQVYGEIPLRDLPVREDHERTPVTVSGIIANSMLDVLAGYRDRHAVEYTALVMPTVYGPRMRPDGNVVAAALAARDNGTEFT